MPPTASIQGPQESLRLVFAQTRGGVWATDRHLRLTYVHGWAPRPDGSSVEALLGTTIYEFVRSSAPTEPVVAHHLAALAGGRQSFLYLRDARWFEVLIEPLRNGTETVVGCVGVAIDVTDKQKALVELARSEARHADAQGPVEVGGFEWDPHANLVTWSDAFQRIAGTDGAKRAASLDAFLAAVHPDDRGELRAAILAVLHGSAPFVGECRLVRPDGATRVMHIACNRVGDLADATAQVVGVCWDITTQHDLSKKLQRSVSLLQATLDATADGILVVDRQGRVAAHNHRFAELWGMPPSLVEGGDDQAMLAFACRQLEDPAAFTAGVRELYAAPALGAFDVLPFIDGRVFERYSLPQRLGADIVGRVWSFRDVTERQRLLDRVTFLADATHLLTSLDVDAALRAVAWVAVPYLGDACAVDLLQGGTPERLVAVPISDTGIEVPAPSAEVLHGQSVMYEKASRSHLSVPLMCRGNVTGVLSFVAPPGRDYGSAELEVAQELARRAALSLDNARLYEGAREALASREEFLSIAAHEIRGPLTSIHLAAQGLCRGRLSPVASRAALDVIQREDRRLGRFVEDLLDLGRIRSGQLRFEIEDVDVGALVRDVVSRLSDDLNQAGSTVTVDTDGDLVGQWDRLRLEQVLTNLLSNAIKFGKGEPIAVRAGRSDGHVRVMVVDHGIGIETSMLTRIFDPFERAVGVRHYGGLGLGLHIAKTIIDALGGTLTVDSRPAEGSAFTVDLPASRSAHHVRAVDPHRG